MLASMALDKSQLGNQQSGKGVWFAIIATLSAGFLVFALGALSKEVGWFLAIYMARLITLCLVVAAQKSIHTWAWQGLPIIHIAAAALVGILQFGGLAAYTMGAQVGPISIAVAAFSVYPIIPMVGGLIYFRERLASRQVLGLASVLAGLLVLSVSA